MTTTPINIDYNGIQINATNNDISITLTMDGSDKGLIFQYDKTTLNPKTFKITSTGFNFTDNTTNYTTPLSNIALLSQVLSSLQVPPNSTTLSVNKTLQLTDGTNTGQIEIQSGVLNIDAGVGAVSTFNQCPQCSIAPTNTYDLVNKTYVDNNVYNITSVNNNQDYYPAFVTGTGTGQQIYVDSTTGPFTYNPSTGNLKSPLLNLDATTPSIRMGTIATTTGYGTNTIGIGTNAGLGQTAGAIALGLNAGSPATGSAQGNNAIAIGQTAGRESQGANAVAIGNACGNTGQGIGAVAIGNQAGQTNQGQYCVALGNVSQNTNAGNYSIGIGYGAGRTNQAVNSIVINATGSDTNNTTASSCVIRPIRGVAQGIGVGRLFYNTSTFEVAYSTT